MYNTLTLSVVTVSVLATLCAGVITAQTNAKGKAHTLYGTVEAIYDSNHTVRVNQEKIEGYSDARIATYRVEDEEILKKLQVNYKITATVYENDYGLYDIRIAEIDDRIWPR
ncbi:MAG TPA: hypothetical protein VKX49_13160 [Bryobacteraceae bacterium]|nr:hypothetical protein [Bryobacteraceae bacterium]